ncbi:hypothetical protein B0H14DRAFT_2899810 [Mycena olivaceomarginata]|nr:hypothetical protein B0H14DRAFT_2899810 [Mycena olivaceomarginata]
MMDATTDLVSRKDADPRPMASKKRHRSPEEQTDEPTSKRLHRNRSHHHTDNEEEEENEDTDEEEVEENEGSDSDGSDVGEIEEDELEELNPSAIQRCRTRGVRVDYTSSEALEKAGLTTEYDADSEDEDAMIEGGCADSEDEDFRMWED